jgi:hypothetical protein
MRDERISSPAGVAESDASGIEQRSEENKPQ